MLKVCLLGQFDVWKDDVRILISSRPAQSLLAYLLLKTGMSHRREKLAGLLWPDSSEDNARSNLRQALWRVRKALDDHAHPERSYVYSDQLSIAFNPDSEYWLDVDVLENQARTVAGTDQLMDHLELYQGELLPGFYDEWVMLERERLQAVFEWEVERLLEQLQNEHLWTELLDWGERWIAHGQKPEPAYRAIMKAYSALGNQSKVVQTYDRCVKALRDDLGVEPSELTRNLFEDLVQGPSVIEHTAAGLSVPPTSGQSQRHPSDRPPYKGLLYFEEADSDLFFGRESLTGRLVARLLDERFLALIGSSGSGKSSLIRAGLVSAIKCTDDLADGSSSLDNRKSPCVQVITPTAQPLESLIAVLVEISASSIPAARFRDDLEHDPLGFHRAVSQILPEPARFVLIVDQFEELFTLCQDPFEREAFVDHLLSAVSEQSGANILVMLALRADFYAHCEQFSGLRQALVEHQEYLGPMSAEELRRVIEEPARAHNWDFEPGVVDLILADIGDEPGRLPLLSHALLETWNRRSGQSLTLKGYTESGGVRGAISRTAEKTFQVLSPDQREIARYIFLHLTELGEGTPDTRRRVARRDLLKQRGGAERIQEVLNLLADARLITISEDSVEVAHEALIRTWGRLRTWLDASRDNLRLRRTLTIVASEWANTGQESSYLATGAQLAQFEALASTSDLKLGRTEEAFLEASLAELNRQQALEQARAAREASLEQRSRNVLRALVGVLLLATFGALALTGLAWSQRRIARQNEVTAQGLALTSGAQFAAIQGDAGLALALALEANRQDPSNVQAQLTLSELAYAPGIRRRLVGHTDPVGAVVFSPQGERALSASWDHSLIVWDVTSGQPEHTLSGHMGPVTAVDFSPDGNTALSGSTDGSLILWGLERGEVIRKFKGHTGEIASVAISPDGSQALSASADQTMILWELTSGRMVRTFIGHDGKVHSAAFSPNGMLIGSGSSDNKLCLWETVSGKRVQCLEGHLGALTAVAFSPDGKTVLSGSLDQVLILWDVASGEAVRRYEGHQDQVNAIAFSPDGKTFISAGGSEGGINTTLEHILILWDVASGELLRRFEGHTGPVTAVAFSPSGKKALSGSADMSLISWGLSGGAEIHQFEGHTRAVNSLGLSADGKLALSGSADTSLILWEVSTGQLIRQIFSDTIIHATALSPDGRRALSGSPDGRLRLWDVMTGEQVGDWIGHTGPVTSVSFSPFGNKALSGSLDRRMILWDVNSGQALLHFTGHTNVVNSVAFSQDGKQALSGSFDRALILWDLDTGQAIRRFPVQDSVINTVTISPDGKQGLSGLADGDLILWDLELGTEIRRFSGHSGPVYASAFSPDGQTAISGSLDQSLNLWDVRTGQPIRRFLGHADAIRVVAFSPDGRTVLSGSLDHSLRLWRIDTLEHLISWTEDNRFIMDLPCEQRAFYHLEPLCEIGDATLSPQP